MSDRVPDWFLERLAKDELPEWRAAELRARLAAEPDGEARLAALAADDAQTLAAHPPDRVASEVRRRFAEAEWRRRRAFATVAGALAAAAAVVVLFVVRPAPRDDGEEVTREKGGTRLVVHRQRGGAVEPLASGAHARAGDLLQLGYATRGAGYGVIVSIDGRGGVTVHLPEAGAEAAALASDGRGALPHAYELDDAPELERFFFVTGKTPFEVAPLVDAAHALAARSDRAVAPLPIPPALRLEQTSFLVEKESP
jgi:hypothetical protein